MKNWRNELFAWLLMLSGLGTILLLMGSTFLCGDRPESGLV